MQQESWGIINDWGTAGLVNYRKILNNPWSSLNLSLKFPMITISLGLKAFIF